MNWFAWVLVALLLAGFVALIVWRERAKSGSQQFAQFLTDVVSEVKKITWPTREDLRKATMVILLFVAIVALVIGAMDIVLQWLLVRLPASI